MKRYFWTIALTGVLAGAGAAPAHFIWIVPSARDQTEARVVLSENLEPDEAVQIEKIAGTKLWIRDVTGRVSPLDWKKGEHAYLVACPAAGPSVVFGACRYGVFARGSGKPFLLNYYPKMIRGGLREEAVSSATALEIVSRGLGKFQVLFLGKPLAGAEVAALGPIGKKNLTADSHGEFAASCAKTGLYGFRSRHVEAITGTHDGKKYEEVRHYATLVVQVDGEQPGKAGAAQIEKRTPTVSAGLPPLPRAVSSFGAAVADGWLYVYGGHTTGAHNYSTEAVIGSFHRLKLSGPWIWEALPPGPPCQGLALVAQRGKIYRVGGMQPRNKPGETADNHSLTECACFDPATRKWEALPDLPAGRSSHDAVIAGDKLIVVGGWNMKGAGINPQWHDTALVLDLAKKPLQWEIVKQPFQRRALAAAVHAGRVYAIAGLGPDAVAQQTVNVFDPAKGEWAIGPSIPGPRSNGFSPAACDAGGRLYVSTGDGKVVRLAGEGAIWEEVGVLRQPRIVHRLVAMADNVLVALGGAGRGGQVAGNVALVETFTPHQPRTKSP